MRLGHGDAVHAVQRVACLSETDKLPRPSEWPEAVQLTLPRSTTGINEYIYALAHFGHAASNARWRHASKKKVAPGIAPRVRRPMVLFSICIVLPASHTSMVQAGVVIRTLLSLPDFGSSAVPTDTATQAHGKALLGLSLC